MKVSVSRSYHGTIFGRQLVRMSDALSAFKVYFVSIIGRDEPARYEWEHSPLERQDVLTRFAASGTEGIGFVTAFPHITKVFRYDPKAEILMTVRAFRTLDFAPLDLQRDEGYMEFACYAEAALAADEYRAWGEAPSVSVYLGTWSSVGETPIAEPGKLRAHYRSTGVE